MSLIPGFKYDIFISYSHNDNLRFEGEVDGWVDRFHYSLRLMLIQRFGQIGPPLNIWFDNHSLDGNTVFDDSIEDGINNSAIMICINSPTYHKSEYCQNELSTFYTKAKAEKLGLKVSRRSRIINVLLNNIPHDIWPLQLQGTTGLHFHNNKGSGHLGDPFETTSPQFKAQMQELRDCLDHLINVIRNEHYAESEVINSPTIPADNDSRPSSDVRGLKNSLLNKLPKIIAISFVVLLVMWAAIWGIPSLSKHPPTIPTNTNVEDALLQINRLSVLSDSSERKKVIDSLSAIYFARRFTVGVSYKRNAPITTIYESGRSYLEGLAVNSHLNDIIVNQITLDSDKKKVTAIRLVEVHKDDLMIQTK